MSSRTDKGEGYSGKTNNDAKIVGTVKSTQITSSLPNSSDPIISTTKPTTRAVTKGVFIGGLSSSSKRAPPKVKKVDKSVGKGILRQRVNDPPSLEKGDPAKHYCYENIEALVVTKEMHDFEKVPKNSFATENTYFNQLDFPVNKMMFLSSQY